MMARLRRRFQARSAQLMGSGRRGGPWGLRLWLVGDGVSGGCGCYGRCGADAFGSGGRRSGRALRGDVGSACGAGLLLLEP